MPIPASSERTAKRSKYERIPLAQLRQSRRGKHRGVVDAIVAELNELGDAEAMRVPLSSVQGVSLANLRSAVGRATKARGVRIATFSDGHSLFLWKKSPGTSRYERKRKSRHA
jgi:hypothetical protein